MIEAMKQALEALYWASDQTEPQQNDHCLCPICKGIDALRQAIAEAEKQEPVAEFKSPSQRWEDGDDHDLRSEVLYKFIADTDFKHCGDSFCFKSGGDGDNGETLMFILDCWFAAYPQPKREWVGLTDEEIQNIAFDAADRESAIILAEAKLREKNSL